MPINNEKNRYYENHCGYVGGSLICVIGYRSDMIFFFECINYEVVRKYPNENFDIILDRLYKRYLKLEELDEAAAKMKIIEEVFKTVDSKLYDWTNIQKDGAKTDLNFRQDTLFDIFRGYFKGFYKCVSSAKYFFNAGESYTPVKVSPTGIAEQHYYSNIPLSELDKLGKDDKPFWQLPWYEYAHLGTNRDKSENLIFKNIFFCSNVIRYKSRFLKKVIADILRRHERMPPGGIQKITIDTEGMQLTQEQENMIKNEIVEKTNGAVIFDNITIKMTKKTV
jgi:hypothetical protein